MTATATGADPQLVPPDGDMRREVRYAMLIAATEVAVLAALAPAFPAAARALALGERPTATAAALVGAIALAGLVVYAIAIVPAAAYARRCRPERLILPHVEFSEGGPIRGAAYVAMVRGLEICTVLLAILVPYAVVSGPVWLVAAIPPCLLVCTMDMHPAHGISGRGPLPERSTVAPETAELIRQLADAMGVVRFRAMLLPDDVPGERPVVGCVSVGKAAVIIVNEAFGASLDRREQKVVFAHELAHHLHRDSAWSFRTRAAMKFPAAMGVCLALSAWGPGAGRGFAAVGAAPIAGLWWYAFRLLGIPLQMAHARRQERRAHRLSLRATDDPGAFASATAKLAGNRTPADKPSLLDKLYFCNQPALSEVLEIGRRHAAGRDGHA